MPDFIFATYKPKHPEYLNNEIQKWVGKKISLNNKPIVIEDSHFKMNNSFLFIPKKRLHYIVNNEYKDKSDQKLGHFPKISVRSIDIEISAQERRKVKLT